VTIEAMRLGAAHILRNPTIYALFNRLGRVTDMGSGVFRMIQRVRKTTGKEVELREEGEEIEAISAGARRPLSFGILGGRIA